jgi:hypothetical protein
MKGPRLKPQGQPVWHHCFNHAVGTSEDRPLGPVEREKFLSILQEHCTLFSLEVGAFIVMGNHFHILLCDPGEPVPEEEVCRRHDAYYPHRAPMEPGTPECAALRTYIADMSEFMGRVQCTFSSWYNKTRMPRRQGAFWVKTFKNTILGDGASVLNGLLYVEANALRAGAAAKLEDYEHSSLSAWVRTGVHPCAETVEKVLLPLMRDVLRIDTAEELLQGLVAQLRAKETSGDGEPEKPFLRRERSWTLGKVIGPKKFIRDLIYRLCGIDPESSHRMLSIEVDQNQKLYVWRRFRKIQT